MNGFTGIGRRIRETREKTGLSQREFADLMNQTRFSPNTKQSHQSLLENSDGERLPSVSVLAALCEVGETNASYILTLTDDPSPPPNLDDQIVYRAENEEDKAFYLNLLSLAERLDADGRNALLYLLNKVAA